MMKSVKIKARTLHFKEFHIMVVLQHPAPQLAPVLGCPDRRRQSTTLQLHVLLLYPLKADLAAML